MARNILMQLQSGQYVDFTNLEALEPNIHDISHNLSMLCRFGGACAWFYSIAQHSLRVASLVPRELKLVALLHDAPEYVILDLIKPAKNQVPGYEELEQRVWLRMADTFDLPFSIPPEVKLADLTCLYNEIHEMMPNPPEDDDFPPEARVRIPAVPRWSPDRAKAEFYTAFLRYRNAGSMLVER